MKSEKQIMEQIDKLEQQRHEQAQSIEDIQEKIKESRLAAHEAAKPFWLKVREYEVKAEKAAEPYRKVQKKLKKQVEEREQKDRELHQKKVELLAELSVLESKKTGVFDERSARQYLWQFKGTFGRLFTSVDYVQNPYKNGVQVIKTEKSSVNVWLAMYKGELIGVSVRRQSKHAGDDTFPFSFIGHLDSDKPMQVEKPNRWSDGTHFEDVGFREWCKELKKLEDPSKHVVKPTSEKLENIIKLAEW